MHQTHKAHLPLYPGESLAVFFCKQARPPIWFGEVK